MSSTLPPLVDEEALARYLADRIPGDHLAVQRLRAGHSNETFFVDWGDHTWVLRRPPRGAFLPSAHDVGREYRVLSALAETPARTPRPVLMCEDETVIGAPFFLMERVEGAVIRDELPSWLGQPDRKMIGTELVDALVELHSIDYEVCGLASLGKPHGYLDRQLRRWAGQLDLTLPLTRPLPQLERVGEWLRANVPASPPATVVHGDFKLDNVVFAPGAPPRLAAILDWEMSTIGDPLADLGWMITFWREPGDDDTDVFARLTSVTEMDGFVGRNQLIQRYESATGRDASALDWYRVLAIWKLAILLEGSYARHLSGVTDDPFFAEMEHGVPALAQRAIALMGDE